jgi:hypothetical protein
VSAGLLSANLGIFGPANVYFSNAHFFAYPLEMMLVPLLGASVAAIFVFTLILVSLPNRLFPGAVALTVMLGAVTWIQGNFLLWDYGVLQGATIKWEEGRKWAWLGVILWLSGLASGLRWRQKISDRAQVLAGFLILLQFTVLVINWARLPPLPAHQRYGIDFSRVFEFSPRENVIVLMLDSFQSNTFAELLEEYPEFREEFDGFTYYRNTTSAYSRTLGSVPSILTGELNRNEQTLGDYIASAYRNSISGKLQQAGWRTELYPWVRQTVHFSPDVAENFKPRANLRLSLSHSAFLLDLGLFRQVPHVLKRTVFNDQNWFLSSGPTSKASQGGRHLDFLQFVGGVEKATLAELDFRPRFVFYHLQGAHAPFWLNAELEPARLPQSSEGYRQQAIACLKLIRLLNSRLHALGIYDQTTLIVTADHGASEYAIPLGRLEGDEAGSDRPGAPDHIRQAGTPLLLMKFPGNSGNIQLSDKPASLPDLPATICTSLGISHGFPGRSILQLEENEERVRALYFYNFDGWDQRFLPPLSEWLVKGHSWSAASWQRTGRVLAAAARLSPDQIAGEMADHAIKFGLHRPGNVLLGSGWHEPEDGLVWSADYRCTVGFTPPPSRQPMLLEAELVPFVDPRLLSVQRVNVLLNGENLVQWQATRYGFFRAWVPAHLLSGRPVELTFELPDSKSPIELGISGDSRQLGIALSSLRLQRIPNALLSAEWNQMSPQGDGSTETVLWVNREQASLFQVTAGAPLLTAAFPATRIELESDGFIASTSLTESAEFVVPRRTNKGIVAVTLRSPPRAGNASDPVPALQVRRFIPVEYTLGDEINFGSDLSSRYCLAGWSSAEKGVPESGGVAFRWTDGRRAAVALRFGVDKRLPEKLRLLFRGTPLLAGSISAQRVNISVNGEQMASLELTRSSSYEFEFPATKLKENIAVIAFELPDAASPHYDLQLNADTRRLGVRMETLRISGVP